MGCESLLNMGVGRRNRGTRSSLPDLRCAVSQCVGTVRRMNDRVQSLPDGHCARGESSADDRADATAPASRDRLELNGRIRVAGRPARRCILPGRVRDGRLHRSILLAAALRRGDDRGGGGPHDESRRRKPRSEIRSFDGVSGKRFEIAGMRWDRNVYEADQGSWFHPSRPV